MNFISWQVIWKRIKAIRFFMKDKTVPLRKKLLILLGIVYLVSPIDLIPAPVLIFGLVDDFHPELSGKGVRPLLAGRERSGSQ